MLKFQNIRTFFTKLTKPKFFGCVLCQHDKKRYDHALRECEIYNNAKAKFDKLKAVGGCVKCSFINHKSSNCKFKFTSNCRHCKGNHMTYLCLRNPDTSGGSSSRPNGPPYESPSGGAPVIARVSTVGAGLMVEAAFSSAGSSITLPTFTSELEGASGRKGEIRIFKDGGC